jgi:DNA-binding MarR family transcriptional regulator
MIEPSDDPEKTILRLWLQMLKITLPLRRHVNIQLQRECGHSLTRFDVLAQLSEFGEQSVGKLAKKLINSSGNIAGLLDRMEGQKLLNRRPDSNDARTLIVTVTIKGSKLYERMVPVHSEIVKEYLGRIDPDHQHTLIAALKSGRTAMDPN